MPSPTCGSVRGVAVGRSSGRRLFAATLLGVALAASGALSIATGRPSLTPGGRGGGQSASPPRVRVTVDATATLRSGATGRPSAADAQSVPVGGGFTAAVSARWPDGAKVCEVTGGRGDQEDEGGYRWRIAGTVRGADAGRVTLELRWLRVGVPGGEAATQPGDRRTVTLREGELHVLDLVHADPGSASPCANVLVRVSAALAEPPSHTHAWLTYDLWLVHEGADGGRGTRHLELAGEAGRPVSFQFAPLRWSLAGGPADAAAQDSVNLAVSGALRGEPRPDGSIDLVLEAVRTLSLRADRASGQGRKAFTVLPGDTVAIEVPGPVGVLTSTLEGPLERTEPWAPGVRAHEGGVTVDAGPFFKGSRWLLVLTVRDQV
jgi:hypothetical protein